MPAHLSTSRFFNPIMLWADVALKTNEMLLSSGSVIQVRTQRMAQAGLSPSEDDLIEMQLMGQEKLDAATQSGAAMANQLQTTQFALVNRAIRQWWAGAAALFGLTISASPGQFANYANALTHATTRSAVNMSQLSSASARIVQRGLKPIHAKATSNARRLAIASA